MDWSDEEAEDMQKNVRREKCIEDGKKKGDTEKKWECERKGKQFLPQNLLVLELL